ncbi:hypothetical protein CRE_06799 [Caenorhabditis remanei]|uniref:DUF7809 domain-containing protein n=1 Tax=Caenorhabditis remanei TaxID=31234 RepID=E3MNV5_CAERE|nr:hypothetical protein CRE_06799 [Caenorhabditis remanei]
MTTPVMTPPPIATDALRIISENYLLEKFRNRSESKDSQSIDKVEEIDMIQVLFENSNDLLKVYGSPEEFVDNLKIYRNFTTSYKYFETKPAIPFYTTPIVYMSLKGGIFMAKADFYVILENIALRNLHPKSNSNIHEVSVYTSFLTLFLKIKAKDVNRKLEFVRFNEKEIDDIENEFVKGMELSKGPLSTDTSFHGRKSPGGTMKNFNKKMREYLPGVADDDALFQSLESANCSFDKEERPLRLAQLMYELETMRSCLKGIINKRPLLFLRKSKETQPSSPIVVRMFEDGDRQFVMNGEFLKAVNLDVNYSPKVFYGVLDMKDVLEKYKDHVDRIEFIRTPILRSKHKAVPIRLIDSLEFCVLAVDGLFEVLKELILGWKLFQHTEIWPIGIFKQIHTVFDPKVTNPYFVNLAVLNNLKKSINQNCLATSSPLSEIRDVKQPGFTIRKLRKDLKFLGLENHFPEITDHAEIVYKQVMEYQKESNPRICDMFDAVEKCQLRCIFDRVPELKTFLHYQKSCSRVIGLKCDICNGAVPESIETIEISATTESLHALEISKSSKSNKKNEEIEKMKNDALTQQKTMKVNKKKKIAALEKEVSELKEKQEEDRGKELEKLTKEKLEPSTRCSTAVLKLEISRQAATINKMGREKGQLKAEIARLKANKTTLVEAKSHNVATISRLEKENKSLKSLNANSMELMTNAVAREEAKFEEMREKFSKRIAELEQELERNRQQAPPTPTPSSSAVASSSRRLDGNCGNCRTFLNQTAPTMECQQCRRRFHPECVTGCWGMKDVCSHCLGQLLIIE